MKFSKKTISASVAIILCLLIGFVFGAAYGLPEGSLSTSGKGQGNVSAISKARLNESTTSGDKVESLSDTLELSAVDSEGRTWSIKMTNTTK